MKQCTICQLTKELSEFNKNKYAKDGLMSKCKVCRNQQLKEYNKNNPHIRQKINKKNKEKRHEYYSKPENKRKYKNNTLKKHYSISIEEYDALVLKQNNLCAICNKPQISTRNKNLAVDHCHKTGKIRGLLCDKCNRSIGLLSDDINLLKEAIKYLEQTDENKSS